MSTTALWREKAGLCPRCGRRQDGATVTCAACRAKLRAYYGKYTHAPIRTALAPAIAGPALGCLCGTFYPIPQIPFVTPCCGFVLALRAEVAP